MRLKEKFTQLKKQNKKAFIAYIPFGYPSIGATEGICLTLQRAGVDVIEIGIPFSDPLADGPIIQKATTTSLSKGANMDNFFALAAKLKKKLKIPVVAMSYYNPIYKFGIDKFLSKLKKEGFSATLVVDLPLEEASDYITKSEKFNLDTVFFATPTSSEDRIKKIVRYSKGFIYYISVTGITGPKTLSYSDLSSHVKGIRRKASVPVCVGFGIHTREQVRRINAFSDGVIVGSEIVKFIDTNHKRKDFLKKLEAHVRSLCTK
jgi:tryptophan synthase alpha chain|tara:strand:+ start:408 stop:1193 length:786 start_codon:yes stop_codon:yes gene_type:complete